MKATFDLPNELLIEAKTFATRRKTSLKALVETALRREIRPTSEMVNPDSAKFKVGSLGYLVLKARPDVKPMTLEDIQQFKVDCDEEDFQRAVQLRDP